MNPGSKSSSALDLYKEKQFHKSRRATRPEPAWCVLLSTADKHILLVSASASTRGVRWGRPVLWLPEGANHGAQGASVLPAVWIHPTDDGTDITLVAQLSMDRWGRQTVPESAVTFRPLMPSQCNYRTVQYDVVFNEPCAAKDHCKHCQLITFSKQGDYCQLKWKLFKVFLIEIMLK